MSLDLQLCAAMRRDGDFVAIKNLGLDPETLQGQGKVVFEWYDKHFRDYGSLPADATFTEHFGQAPDVLFPEAPESLKFYIESLKKRAALAILQKKAMLAIEQLGKGDPEAVTQTFKQAVVEVLVYQRGAQPGVNITKQVEPRIEQYDHIKSVTDGIDGYPTPWPSLDRMTQGWHNGEFNLFIGLVGIGKTWGLLHTCIQPIIKNRTRTLIISMEMPAQQLGRRFDAVYGRIPFQALRRGQLDEIREAQYKQQLRNEYKDLPDVWVYTQPTVSRVSDIELLIEQHKPEIVFIDSVYLLREGKSEERFIRTIEAIEHLKPLALGKNVPIIGTTQFKADQKTAARAKEGKGGIEDMGYAASALSANADNILSFHRPPDLKANKQMLIRGLKTREEDMPYQGLVVNWDFITMDTSEVGTWDGERVIPIGQTGDREVDF